MDNEKRAYLELHIAVLLFGLTAILGELISLSAVVLVWWRVFITSISLLFFINFGQKLKSIPRKLTLQYMGIGILIGLHWITFFGSVKLSNVSICLVCMATVSFFTSILEPLILKKPFKWFEVALGLTVIPGMALVVNYTELSMQMGIWSGLLSALLASIFIIFNKKLVDKAEPMSITFLELSSACLFIGMILPVFFHFSPESNFLPQGNDWLYLLVLALLCTTLAYVLSLRALRYLSAFASNLTVNLEPIYGIILAVVILNENKELTAGFYIGGAIILLSVLAYPFLKKRFVR